MKTAKKRLQREARTVDAMLQIYCRQQHGSQNGLCDSCASLNQYADQRLKACPFGEGKTVCSKCPVHCYSPAKREQIRQVMRFTGPRMLWSHPWLTLIHFRDKRREAPLSNLGLNIIEVETRK